MNEKNIEIKEEVKENLLERYKKERIKEMNELKEFIAELEKEGKDFSNALITKMEKFLKEKTKENNKREYKEIEDKYNVDTLISKNKDIEEFTKEIEKDISNYSNLIITGGLLFLINRSSKILQETSTILDFNFKLDMSKSSYEEGIKKYLEIDKKTGNTLKGYIDSKSQVLLLDITGEITRSSLNLTNSKKDQLLLNDSILLLENKMSSYNNSLKLEVENRHKDLEIKAMKEIATVLENEYYLYTAVLDSSTCEECQSYDGKIYKVGNEPTLPIHTNCRCDLLPATNKEVFKSKEK